MNEYNMLEFVRDNAEIILDGGLDIKIGFVGGNVEHDNFGIKFVNPLQGYTENKEHADSMVSSAKKALFILQKAGKKDKKGEKTEEKHDE